MATVNKASLRTEFDALKARFESLCAAGKMSAESRALVDALLMLFELLMAVFMEKHTPKSSANSRPSRLAEPQRRHRPLAPRRQGQGALVQRCALRQHPAPASTSGCSPSILGARCGEDLTDTACTGHQRRTLVDIVFEKVVRHADAEIKHCTRCHAGDPCALPRRDVRTAAVRPRRPRPTSCTCSSRRCSH